MARAGIIAALYVVVTYVLAPVSFGPVQFRLSEALTLLPMLFAEAVPALYVGVLLANVLGGLGLWDILGGSAVTLAAAYITYYYRWTYVGYLAPVVLNALLIPAYLAPIFNLPYWPTVLTIGASEAVVVLVFGVPLVHLLRRAGLGTLNDRGIEN
jgi:uncharacterized membrane protein